MKELLIAGVFCQILITLALALWAPLPPLVLAVLAGYCVVSSVGVVGLLAGHPRFGTVLTVFGALPFVPPSLIAVYAAHRLAEEHGGAPRAIGRHRPFFASASVCEQFLVTAALCLLVGGAVVLVVNDLTPLVIGLWALGLGLWYRHAPVVRLYRDRMELRLSPVGGRHVVRFGDMQALFRQRPGDVRLAFRHRGHIRILRLPVRLLSAEDRRTLVRQLQATVRGRLRPAG